MRHTYSCFFNLPAHKDHPVYLVKKKMDGISTAVHWLGFHVFTAKGLDQSWLGNLDPNTSCTTGSQKK